MLHIIMVYISELGTSCSEEPQKSRFENNCFSDSKQENYVGFKSHAWKKKTFFLSFFIVQTLLVKMLISYHDINNFTECSRIILIKFINERITNSYNTYSLSERAGSRSYSYCANISGWLDRCLFYTYYTVYNIHISGAALQLFSTRIGFPKLFQNNLNSGFEELLISSGLTTLVLYKMNKGKYKFTLITRNNNI